MKVSRRATQLRLWLPTIMMILILAWIYIRRDRIGTLFCMGYQHAHEKYKSRPFLVYVRSSSIQQPGFVSYPFNELDLTNDANFESLLLPETVDTFSSEHTFEKDHQPLL